MKIKFKNFLGTIESFFRNDATVARNYQFQDRDGTIADDTDLASKQDELVSATNIKTINGSSILGAGNLVVGTVESVTGDGVDLTDPDNPVLNFPISTEVQFTTTPNISATNVQAAIEEVDTDLRAAIVSAVEGLKWKDSVVVATTANITLSGEQTIDGILTSASRVLVKDQSTGSQNGIYVSAASAWVRSSDANTAAELEGATVPVQRGTSNANTSWTQTADNITLGSTSLAWSQIGSSVPDSSESVKGIIEIATQAETNTGTDDVRALTPLKAATRYAPLTSVNVTSSTGTAIKFDIPRSYGITTAETGNITFDSTGAALGIVQLVRHNNGTTPTFGSQFKKLAGSGNYVTGVLNYIYCEYISSTEIIYSIDQQL